MLEAECMCSSAVRRSSLCFSLCRTCQCVGHFLWGLCTLFVSSPHRRCQITKKPPGSFQEPRRHTFPPKEWDPSWISQVSGWHNTRANHFVLKPPLPLSFLLPSKSRSCVEQVLGLFHSVVFTSDPLCWWMYKSAHQGVLVRSNKCGPSLHSFHENTPAAVDATH